MRMPSASKGFLCQCNSFFYANTASHSSPWSAQEQSSMATSAHGITQGEMSRTSPESSCGPWPEFFWRVPGLLLPAEGPLLQGGAVSQCSPGAAASKHSPGMGTGTAEGLPAAPGPGAALHKHLEMLQPGQSPRTSQKHPQEQLECLGMSARLVCRGAQTAIPGATSWSSHTPPRGPGDAR
ncbi:uncharacterized protein LOC134547494 isoform X7 [Prinia subflava]|uniref:uncharacterized protein LOC134547494 isoform X7 n=1 Tax=Prinia subflava TaxID=208062 RepID=UPI002FE3664A